jgi:hypothetical protein
MQNAVVIPLAAASMEVPGLRKIVLHKTDLPSDTFIEDNFVYPYY